MTNIPLRLCVYNIDNGNTLIERMCRVVFRTGYAHDIRAVRSIDDGLGPRQLLHANAGSCPIREKRVQVTQPYDNLHFCLDFPERVG